MSYATQQFQLTITVSEDPGASMKVTFKLRHMSDEFESLQLKPNTRLQLMTLAVNMFEREDFEEATMRFTSVTYKLEKL